MNVSLLFNLKHYSDLTPAENFSVSTNLSYKTFNKKIKIKHYICTSLTSCWLVVGVVEEGVVADEAMKLLHRWRGPAELH